MSGSFQACGSMPVAYAVYRLPYADHFVRIEQIEGEPEVLSSCVDLNGRKGFVIAPFQVTAEQPILLIHPDRVEQVPLKKCTWAEGQPAAPFLASSLAYPRAERAYYAIDFANYHAQLEAGTLQKIVLARCTDEKLAESVSPLDLFYRACERYPRMFIALMYTARSGCWLAATPEILLDRERGQWRTIALAGTMRLEGEQLNFDTQKPFNPDAITWSQKNIQEQRIVATYITECLEQFTGDFSEEGPRTVRAANLVHLRSDFTFTLADSLHLGDLLQTLYPTPAVCGLPKRRAFDFIVKNEHTPRRYYSGFMGPVNGGDSLEADGGDAFSTHLYVSLRCMNIESGTCHLYAGGGLLRDSSEEKEWLETEAKLETMRTLLH